MHYHIQTAPIWDAYKTEKDCPLCKIYADREKRVIGQYLNENVMDPDFRVRSNRVGFCKTHIKALYSGQNKLGLALQLETRADALDKLLSKPPADKKSAKKTAELLYKHYGCVVCDALEEPMSRYFITVAEMFENEPDFPELFGAAHHCIEHSIRLYDAAQYAGKSVNTFCATLTSSLKRDLRSTEKSLRSFADCFDFKNAGTRPDPQVIPDAVKLLNGIKVEL